MSEQPADLNGQPIPAAAARELAADGEWRRWTLDPAGQLLDVGDRTYRPTAALARHVRGRDRTCRFPTCNQPAVDCHLDHIVAFHTADGPTTRLNLGSLCQHHHRLKHETDWTYTLDERYRAVWTAPSGRTYTTPAEHHGHPDDHNTAEQSAHVADLDELADDPALSTLFTHTHARQRHREQRAAARQQQKAGPDPWVTPPDPDIKEPPF